MAHRYVDAVRNSGGFCRRSSSNHFRIALVQNRGEPLCIDEQHSGFHLYELLVTKPLRLSGEITLQQRCDESVLGKPSASHVVKSRRRPLPDVDSKFRRTGSWPCPGLRPHCRRYSSIQHVREIRPAAFASLAALLRHIE